MSAHDNGTNFSNGFRPPVSTQLKNVVSLLRPAKPGLPLPADFEPGPNDVCSGRGKRNWNHAGNIDFRNLIQASVEGYMSAPNKNEKTAIVCTIVDNMRREGSQFLQQNQEGLWYDIGDAKARDKVGHSLRDQVTAINKGQVTMRPLGEAISGRRSYVAFREPIKSTGHARTRIQQMKELEEDDQQMMALSDNEAEAEESYRRCSNTAQEIEKFVRRPSWIAGEFSTSSQSMEGISAMDLERRRSSVWGMLGMMDGNVLQDLMNMDTDGDVTDHAVSPNQDAQTHKTTNQYGYNYEQAVAPVPFMMVATQTKQDKHDLSSEQIHNTERFVEASTSTQSQDSSPSSHIRPTSAQLHWSQNPSVARPPLLETTDSQLALFTEEGDEFVEDDEAAAYSPKPVRLPNRRIVSDSTNLLKDSLKSWDAHNSITSTISTVRMSDVTNSSNSLPTPQRSNARRLSGATLRRATNSLRLSELSIGSDLLEGIADWSDDVDIYEEI